MTAHDNNKADFKGVGRDGDKFQAKIIYADENLYVGRYDQPVERLTLSTSPIQF